MIIKELQVGIIGTNCYIIADEITKECAIVDPGDNAFSIINIIEDNKLRVKYILLTHGHFDHIMAVSKLREKYNVDVIIHEDEAKYLRNPNFNLSATMDIKPIIIESYKPIKDNDEIQIGSIKVKAIKVPGHTEASVCYYIESENILIAGDTLFKDSIGRSDLYGGDRATLVNSIKTKLLTLPDNTKVYPGHGQSTSIGYEKENNSQLNFEIGCNE